MPRYEITSPDGKRFEITAPEGATQEQVLEYAQQQFAAQAAPTPATVPPAQAAEQPPLSQRRLADIAMSGGGPIVGIEGASPAELIERGGYRSGEAVTDVLAPHVPPEVAGGAGFAANVATQAVPAVLGGIAGRTVAPAVLEPIKAAGKAVAGGVRNVANLFTDKGAGRILTNYQDRIIGKGGRQSVIDALKKAGEPVPGFQPTAAEAVARVPAGSPLIAHQKITAGTPGGPSAAFGQRALDQKAALEAAVASRGAATAPLREAAISAANVGGVKSDAVVSGIDATLGQPGIRASEVVGKTLNSVKDKIAQFTDEATGVIDANDLYTIRKEIGNTIKTHAKDTANWDKRLAAGLERDVQKAIDDAIESAGGTGWREYLREFASRSTGIEAAKEGVKAAAKPAQRTNLGGGVNVAEESRLHLPQMLSRPMMIANAIMNRVGRGVEPRLDAEATRRYLDPQRLAQALETLPPEQQSVVSALLQRIMGTTAGAGGGALYGAEAASP